MREGIRVDLRNTIEQKLFDPITNTLTHFGRQLFENALDDLLSNGELRDADNGGKIFSGTMKISQEFNLHISVPK